MRAQILPELTEHRLAEIRASHKPFVIEGGIEMYLLAAYKEVALCVFNLEKSQVDSLGWADTLLRMPEGLPQSKWVFTFW